MDLSRAKAARRRPRDRHIRKRGQARQGRAATPPTCWAGRRSNIITRRLRWSWPNTFEQARAAAQLVRVEYEKRNGRTSIWQRRKAPRPWPRSSSAARPDTAVGDFAGAFASAPVQLDATYTTPDESHAMMEPHASIAAWEGDKLTFGPRIRWLNGARATWPRRSAFRKENVRVISPFIGGGFGGKAVPQGGCPARRPGRTRRPSDPSR